MRALFLERGACSNLADGYSIACAGCDFEHGDSLVEQPDGTVDYSSGNDCSVYRDSVTDGLWNGWL